MTLSRNLADVYASEGIRVNHLNLGWALTSSEDELLRAEGRPPGWAEDLPPTVATPRALLHPDDVAHFALAIVEQSAHGLSGTVVDLEPHPMMVAGHSTASCKIGDLGPSYEHCR